MKITPFFLLLPIQLWGQSIAPEVVAPAGEHYTSGGTQLSWTLGELVSETFSQTNVSITQGFHQPAVTILAIGEPNSAIGAKVYPNPSGDEIILELKGNNGYVTLTLTSADGKEIYEKATTPEKNILHLNLRSFTPGIYLLKAQTQNGEPLGSWRVVKIGNL